MKNQNKKIKRTVLTVILIALLILIINIFRDIAITEQPKLDLKVNAQENTEIKDIVEEEQTEVEIQTDAYKYAQLQKLLNEISKKTVNEEKEIYENYKKENSIEKAAE